MKMKNMTEFSGTNLIMDDMQENTAGRSRKAARALALRDSMAKTREFLIIRAWSNLIMPEASGRGDSPGISIRNEVEIKNRLCH
jgi:hypothetical protein